VVQQFRLAGSMDHAPSTQRVATPQRATQALAGGMGQARLAP